jgi:hypothetical protein
LSLHTESAASAAAEVLELKKELRQAEQQAVGMAHQILERDRRIAELEAELKRRRGGA